MLKGQYTGKTRCKLLNSEHPPPEKLLLSGGRRSRADLPWQAYDGIDGRGFGRGAPSNMEVTVTQ